MPMSAKEKMQRYREKIKLNAVKAEFIKMKDCKRKQEKKARMTKTEIKRELKMNRERVRLCRQRKKDKLKDPVAPTSPIKAFLTPQSLGKARQRAFKSLPKSPKRRKAIIEKLADEVGITLQPLKRKRTEDDSRPLNPETIRKVKEFYLSTSWMCPGQKDYVLIKENESKKKVQKHFLITTLRESHTAFQWDNPGHPVSFSKFSELRPKQVLLQGNIPHTSCLCKYHENVQLLLKTLNKAGMNLPTQFRDFIGQIVCDQSSSDCMNGSCKNCPGIGYFAPNDDPSHSLVEWQQWRTDDGKAVKMVCSGTIEDCYQELSKQVPYFLWHTHVKRVQSAAFQWEKETVKNLSYKVVIQVDFAENYSTKTQNEIQSAHWTYNQVALFTACAWEQTGIHSVVVVSDYLSHDKYAVNAFFKLVLNHLDKTIHPFEEVIVFSDGSGSQFKNKFLFNNITHMRRQVTWNFLATSHGKGAVDGIGGEMKHLVATQVLSGISEVQNAADFVKVASSKSLKTTVLYCSKDDVEKDVPMLITLWEGIAAIPATKLIHQVRAVQPDIVEVRKLSNTGEAVTHCFHTQAASNSEAVNLERNEAKCTFTKCIYQPDPGISDIDVAQLVVGKWVVVRYCGKNNTRSCVGQILERSKDLHLVVKFVKKKGNASEKFKWPEHEDVDTVNITDVVKLLPEPQMDRRDTLQFPDGLFLSAVC